MKGRRRRGFVLLVVLVVVAAAVLAVTGTIFLVRGEVAGTANAGEAIRTRAVAWSGVQAVAATLGAARGEILAGADPIVEGRFTVWEAGGERGTVRLMPLGPAGRTVLPENAKIDLFAVDAEGLERSGAVDAEAAARIIAARDACGGRPLDLASLLAHGARAEDLHGELDAEFLGAFGDAALEIARSGAATPRGLGDVATVFAFDPPIRADGSPRIFLGGERSEDDRKELDARLGEGAAEAIGRIEAADEAELLGAWASQRPDPAAWSRLLDAVTLIDGGFVEGRIDLLRADEAALQALPGLPDGAAARIVREREAVPAETRLDPSWLVARGIVDAETFLTLLPRLATRSLFWRVRVEGRIERVDDDREATPGNPAAPRTILEAVIDLTGERPRLASLRDVTALPDAIRMLAALPATPENDAPPEEVSPPDVVDEPATEAGPAATPRSGANGIGRWKRAG